MRRSSRAGEPQARSSSPDHTVAMGRPTTLQTMSQITKSVRLSGSSSRSIEDAIRTVLARAATTIDEITRFDVVDVWGAVDGSGVPTEFSVTLDITFVVKESVHG